MIEFNELAHEDALPSSYEETNWFSIPYVTRVHGKYISLDVDQNGIVCNNKSSDDTCS